MTGEIDLLGKVMPVGGIKEKAMAARRSNVSFLVFPQANKRDYDELPEHLKAGLEVHFADTYSSVVRPSPPRVLQPFTPLCKGVHAHCTLPNPPPPPPCAV